MYDEVMKVIEAGGYDLSDLLHRIDVLYIGGKLTDDEREHLVDEAREKSDPTAAYAPIEQRLAALEAWRTEVDAKLATIEAGGAEPEEPAEEYPAWKNPTCAEDAYYTGMKMTYTDGKRYECTAPEDYGVTWGPDVLPDMWREIMD